MLYNIFIFLTFNLTYLIILFISDYSDNEQSLYTKESLKFLLGKKGIWVYTEYGYVWAWLRFDSSPVSRQGSAVLCESGACAVSQTVHISLYWAAVWRKSQVISLRPHIHTSLNYVGCSYEITFPQDSIINGSLTMAAEQEPKASV